MSVPQSLPPVLGEIASEALVRNLWRAQRHVEDTPLTHFSGESLDLGLRPVRFKVGERAAHGEFQPQKPKSSDLETTPRRPAQHDDPVLPQGLASGLP